MGIFKSTGVKILVVDDEPSVVDVFSQYLTGAGYRVQSAANGKEALDVFKKDQFQLVITDIEMPEIDGMALIDRIKAVNKDVVVIVVTGYGTIERAVEAIKKGAYDFLEKPLSFKALDMVVNRALERYFIYKNLRMFRTLFILMVTVLPVVLLTGVVLGHFLGK
ncbi:MAG: response regulator [Deltaproteobacteria bacterium]|nr:response regulator [Deltaproteobacteria bacterium]